LASITEHSKWGSSHRVDETYQVDIPEGTNPISPVMTLEVSCVSKTHQCKTNCGELLTNIAENRGNHCTGCSVDLTMDKKHDFNAARFKTGALTYCDPSGAGRLGAVSISNAENEISHGPLGS
jgi:hypothetical protein